MISEPVIVSKIITQCVYCNSNVDSTKKVRKNNSVWKKVGLRHIFALLRGTAQEEVTDYVTSVQQVSCPLCGKQYLVLCNDKTQCKDVYKSITPFGYNKSKEQELKTKLSRMGMSSNYPESKIIAFTFDKRQGMINLVGKGIVFVLSHDEGEGNERKYILEDVYKRNGGEHRGGT